MSVVSSPQWMYNPSTSFYDHELDQSLRFNAADSAYLQKTFSGAGNRRTFTISFWFKRCRDDTAEYLFAGGDDTSNRFHMDINASGTFQIEGKSAGSTDVKMEGGPRLRDLGAWYHFVLRVDTTSSTASERVRLYVNGELLTFNSNTFPGQNFDLNWNAADQVRIGRAGWTTSYYDGYMCEFINVDGSSLGPTSFGQFKQDIWTPIEYSGSYGTNGFKLSFQDSSALGDDTSGNGHDFTANNLAATDQVPDSPTNNFATFHPLLFTTTPTVQEGNLKGSLTSGSGQANRSRLGSTFHITSGQWYWELTVTGAGDYVGFGISRSGFRYMLHTDPTEGVGFASFQTQSTAAVTYYAKDGTGSTATSSTGPSITNIVQIALDADAGKMWVGDGTNFYSGDGTGNITGTSGNPAAGTNAPFTGLDFSEPWTPIIEMTGANETETFIINFGQDSSFAGTETAQGNSDSRGNGDFYYTPPSGFLALCTANLPNPGIDPNNNESPADYFNTVLYTGNSATAQSITGVGFQPDFLWFKQRGRADEHALFDVIRGAGNYLRSNRSNAEGTDATGLTSFDSDGFSLGTDGAGWLNQGTDSMVAWAWKAGGTAVSNTDGSITSSVSASPESGFSIVTHTSNNGSYGTVGHGLSSTPELLINKDRDASDNWIVYTTVVDGSLDVLRLNLTNSAVNSSATAPTSTVFESFIQNGNDVVTYCFHSVEGYSRVGKYTGTGNSSPGPFLFFGFRPAFLIVKKADAAENWFMIDVARQPTNDGNIPRLLPNLSNAEATDASIAGDFVSNGFQVRATQNMINNANSTYIYFAFADQPFKYANAK